MFDIPLFSSLLSRVESISSDENKIEDLLDTYDESPKEREERKRLINICHDVMVAERYEDVDVSLEDLVKLATVYEDVKELYCTSGSGEAFRTYQSRLMAQRTLLKRRVL